MRRCLRSICKLILASIFGAGISSVSAFAEEEKSISALVYDFPPYYQLEDDGTYSGIGIELLKVMSEISPDYEFGVVSSSPRRRHTIFQNKKVDISLFDQMSWGWGGKKVDHTDVYMHGGERYIAARNPDAVETFSFDNIGQRRIAAILGYHYNFADYQTDPVHLHGQFDIALLGKQDQIIKMVKSRRVEVGVVTEAYFLSYLARRPALKQDFIVSEIYDQEYNFVGIRATRSEISKVELNELIARAVMSKDYQSILSANGLANN